MTTEEWESIWEKQMGQRWRMGDPVFMFKGELTGIRSDRFPEGTRDHYYVIREGKVVETHSQFIPDDDFPDTN